MSVFIDPTGKETAPKTRVIFRTFNYNPGRGQVIALFPDEVERDGSVMSYMRIGQHSSADYTGIVTRTRLATPEEIMPLKRELQSIGYNLKVRKKR